jgi:hypothetical protein
LYLTAKVEAVSVQAILTSQQYQLYSPFGIWPAVIATAFSHKDLTLLRCINMVFNGVQ